MRGAEDLSEKEPPFVMSSASFCPATHLMGLGDAVGVPDGAGGCCGCLKWGWGMLWVPQMGLGDAVDSS